MRVAFNHQIFSHYEIYHNGNKIWLNLSYMLFNINITCERKREQNGKYKIFLYQLYVQFSIFSNTIVSQFLSKIHKICQKSHIYCSFHEIYIFMLISKLTIVPKYIIIFLIVLLNYIDVDVGIFIIKLFVV